MNEALQSMNLQLIVFLEISGLTYAICHLLSDQIDLKQTRSSTQPGMTTFRTCVGGEFLVTAIHTDFNIDHAV